MTWYVLKIAPPVFAQWHEFAVRDELVAHGRGALVPVEFRLQKRGGSIRRPRVPGYVFAEDPPHDIFRHRGCIGLLRLGMDWLTLTQAEIDALEALSQPVTKQVNRGRYRIGDTLTIRKGHMTTIDALVVRIEDGEIVASYDMLGKPHEIRIKDVEAA